MSSLIYSAEAWRLLHGLVSVYKPAGMSQKMLYKVLQHALVNDLNAMQRKVEPGFLLGSSSGQVDVARRYTQWPQSKLVDNKMEISAMASIESTRPETEDNRGELLSGRAVEESWYRSELELPDEPVGSLPLDRVEQLSLLDYSSHPSVLGPGYRIEDITVEAANVLPANSSGVVVLGLNKSAKLAKTIRRRNPLLSLEVECQFGKATDTGFRDGKTVAKATWKHLKNRRWHMDQIVSNIQATHQKMAWKAMDLDPESQEAYELAVQGPIKPDMLTDTIIYGIRCLDWKLPSFTLKVECVGENQQFIHDLVSEIAIRLKTHGHCTKIRCGQVGPFTADQSLLPQQLNLESVLRKIGQTKKLVRANKPHYRRQNFTSIKTEEDIKIEQIGAGNEETEEKEDNTTYGRFKL